MLSPNFIDVISLNAYNRAVTQELLLSELYHGVNCPSQWLIYQGSHRQQIIGLRFA